MMTEMGVVRQDHQRTEEMVQVQVSLLCILNKIPKFIISRATGKLPFLLIKWKMSNINTKDSAKISPLESSS